MEPVPESRHAEFMIDTVCTAIQVTQATAYVAQEV
jgi:hypothetical protein